VHYVDVSGHLSLLYDRFTTGKTTRYPLRKRLNGPQNRSGYFLQEDNLLTLQGIGTENRKKTSHNFKMDGFIKILTKNCGEESIINFKNVLLGNVVT